MRRGLRWFACLAERIPNDPAYRQTGRDTARVVRSGPGTEYRPPLLKVARLGHVTSQAGVNTEILYVRMDLERTTVELLCAIAGMAEWRLASIPNESMPYVVIGAIEILRMRATVGA
jgi:hypothetical protein